ncbi:acyl carrier protein [Streptomyces sp. NPDC003006]
MTPPYETLFTVLTAHFDVPEERVTPQATFRDMELDSLARAELALVMGQRLGVRCQDADVPATMSTRQLAAVLEDRMTVSRRHGAP